MDNSKGMVRDKISFLVLDYQRPEESELCLKSIRYHVGFKNYQIVFMSNGGDGEYAYNLSKKYEVEKLIIQKHGFGCGIGTRQLFQSVALESEFAVYVQSDQYLGRAFNEDELNKYINLLRSEPKVKHVDLSGNQGHGKYSERAHFTSVDFYNENQKAIGGPGLFGGGHMWTEEYMSRLYDTHGYRFVLANLMFIDNGKVSIREFPCGGILKHYTDSKKLFVIKPPKQKYTSFGNYPLTDSEWDDIINGRWVDGTIPENLKPHSFVYFK